MFQMGVARRRLELRGEAPAHEAAAASTTVMVLVDSEAVALVEVERVAERVVPELPDARAAAPPHHPLAVATRQRHTVARSLCRSVLSDDDGVDGAASMIRSVPNSMGAEQSKAEQEVSVRTPVTEKDTPGGGHLACPLRSCKCRCRRKISSLKNSAPIGWLLNFG
ncbi:hypothetical protein U9M48_025461 [Paspalum notatum var. saurae]|uniref:Uncharacterized protein n=1 Tax=Paspalum notatum var. saurae TaxID=547442 RepID=A0AAQ3TV01_PASNO